MKSLMVLLIFLFLFVNLSFTQSYPCTVFINPQSTFNTGTTPCGMTLDTACNNYTEAYQSCVLRNNTDNMIFNFSSGIQIIPQPSLYNQSLVLNGQQDNSTIFQFQNPNWNTFSINEPTNSLTTDNTVFTVNNVIIQGLNAEFLSVQSRISTITISISGCQFNDSNFDSSSLFNLKSLTTGKRITFYVSYSVFQNSNSQSTLVVGSLFDGVNVNSNFYACSFIQNLAFSSIIQSWNGVAVFVHCEFINNTITQGGMIGLFNQTVLQIIIDCKFIGNSLHTKLINYNESSLVQADSTVLYISESEFSNNQGIIAIWITGLPSQISVLNNTLFSGNSVYTLINVDQSSVLDIQSSTFTDNSLTSLIGKSIFTATSAEINFLQITYTSNSGEFGNFYNSNITLDQVNITNNNDFSLFTCASSVITYQGENSILGNQESANDLISCSDCTINQSHKSDPNCSATKSNTDKGKIIAAVICSFVGLLVIIALIACCCRRHHHHHHYRKI